MNEICIISTELPPNNNYATTADEGSDNIISVIQKLNMKLIYIFIDEDRHYYKDTNPEKKLRIDKIKKISDFYIIKKDNISNVKKKVKEIIKNNNLKNFFIFQHCIDFIDQTKDQKILMWGIHDNIFPRVKNIYFQKNILKKFILFFYYKILNLIDHFKFIQKLKKANLILQPGRIYYDKWKKYLKNKTKIIFIPQCTKDYKKFIKSKVEINFYKDKKNCLLIGQPNSSMASSNIKYLCENILPILDNKKIINKFHFFIIGMIHNKLNPNIDIYIKKWSEHITLTNFIDDLNTTMFFSDAVIQINPIIPVAPIRIYGWSSLSPLLIANKDITINFPELINNENCYLGKSNDDYTKIFEKILHNDPNNQNIRKNIRKLYDNKWNYENYINSLETIFKNFFIDGKIENKYFD